MSPLEFKRGLAPLCTSGVLGTLLHWGLGNSANPERHIIYVIIKTLIRENQV